MKKVIIISITSFFGFFILMLLVVVLTLSSNMKQIRSIEIADFNLTTKEDNIYEGAYYFEDQIGASVSITVLDGKITDISVLEHLTGKGEKAEELIPVVIEEQTLLVDNIAGATTSSHVIKLAIQDALKEE